MRINPLPVYQRGQKRKTRSRPANTEERKHWERVRALGCMACGAANPEIHHTGTGAGGRRDHTEVIGLCRTHHTGAAGIHHIGRRKWQEQFGTERQHLERVARLLGMSEEGACDPRSPRS